VYYKIRHFSNEIAVLSINNIGYKCCPYCCSD